MMKKTFMAALLGLLVIAALAVPPAAASQKEIHVAPGETQAEIVSFGGQVLIEGTVTGDVLVIGGSITISGEAQQSVVGIGSKIVVKSTARIAKDLAALGGTLEKEPGCAIGGDTIYFQTGELSDRLFRDGHVFRSAFSLSLIPIIVAVKLALIFLWLIVAVTGASLFPKPIAYAAGEIRQHFWPAFLTGFVALVVFFMLLLFAGMLSFILIGIPIALALIVAGFVVNVFARLSVFYYLGAAVVGSSRGRAVSPMAAVLMGLLLFSLAGFVPVLGFLFALVMTAVGWGIAIRTKFGSRENWFVKTPPAAC